MTLLRKKNLSICFSVAWYKWIEAMNAICNIMADHVYYAYALLKQEKLLTQASTMVRGQVTSKKKKLWHNDNNNGILDISLLADSFQFFEVK